VIGPLIELDRCSVADRTRHGPVEVLREASLVVRESEAIRLTGPSGSGKTTIALLCAGLLRPTSGVVRLHDDSGRRSPSSPVQIVFQDPYAAVNPRRRIIDWLRLAAGVRFCPGRRALSRLRHLDDELARLSATVGLNRTILTKYPLELSGGECQRATIVAAIAARPRCIIFDEPFSMQDEASADSIARAIHQARLASGFTSFIISHRDYPGEHDPDGGTILYELRDHTIQRCP
jgi:peptide/nickel transport system ATP-binding protein